jgi:hypothetical protein
MSHSYTPSPVPIVSTTLPDDGDLASAVSVNTPFEDALDAVKYAQDAIDGTSTGTMTPLDLSVAAGSLNANNTEVTTGVPFIAADTVTCNSTLTVGGALTCNATAHHVGAVTCASTLGVTGTFTGTTINATVRIELIGTITCTTTAITCSKILGISGGIAHREYMLPDSGPTTVTVADGDVFVVPNISADRTYSIGTAGAIDGQWVKFVANNAGGGFKATVVYGATSTQMSAQAPLAGVIQTTSLELRMRAGVWTLETRTAWY